MKSEIVSSIENYFRGIFAQSNLHKLTILLQPWNMRCHQPTIIYFSTLSHPKKESIVPNVPLKDPWARWYVLLLFSKILAYNWRTNHYNCTIASFFKNIYITYPSYCPPPVKFIMLG
jgi:hypothetical protein